MIVGVAKSEISSRHMINCHLQGFANPEQIARSVREPLYSRCFVFCDKDAECRCVALVVVDIWSCTMALKKLILDKIADDPTLKDLFFEDNLQVCGTHTHSGPSGLSSFKLYQVFGADVFGFNRDIAGDVADAVVKSISSAYQTRKESIIRLGEGICPKDSSIQKLKKCGGQRSSLAYQNNPQAELDLYGSSTDETMTLVRIDDLDANPIGMICWYPIHGTDYGQKNLSICGDNKGLAANYFETAMHDVSDKFVAAFANSNAGDVSGNIDYFSPPDGTHDHDHAVAHGTQQFEAALSIYNTDLTKISGAVWCCHQKHDLSQVKMPDGTRTFPAAIGLSTLAGSREDGDPGTLLREGITTEDISGSEQGFLLVALEASQFLLGIRNPKGYHEDIDGHHPKPIVFFAEDSVPSCLPLQVVQFGGVLSVGVPGELTTMAGRRLRKSIENIMKAKGMPDYCVVLTCYSNGYSQYITTPEEYQKQHYEGASTLYGPYTLNAYEYLFSGMLNAAVSDR
jgi:neutral ceramidase